MVRRRRVRVKGKRHCRAALEASAAPTLIAAGASLAADFVQSGLTQADAVVLARLLAMLTDPLAAMRQTPQVCGCRCVVDADAEAPYKRAFSHGVAGCWLLRAPLGLWSFWLIHLRFAKSM